MIKDIIPENCKKCDLYKSRTNIVWGNGNYLAKIAFLGEGPGRDEDEAGLAFVGRSGIFLQKILKAYKLSYKNVLILNLVKCRPPNNRNPSLEEILSCRVFLKKQMISCPNLKVIVALGKVPWYGITGEKLPVTKFHGKTIKKGKYIYLYTYHPSFLIRRNDVFLNKNFMRDIKKAIKISQK